MSVCLSLAAFPHYYTNPDVTWGRQVEVVHYLGRFAISARVSMTTLRRTRNVSECLYSLCAWFHLSLLLTVLRLSSSHTDVAVVVADADDDSGLTGR